MYNTHKKQGAYVNKNDDVRPNILFTVKTTRWQYDVRLTVTGNGTNVTYRLMGKGVMQYVVVFLFV